MSAINGLLERFVRRGRGSPIRQAAETVNSHVPVDRRAAPAPAAEMAGDPVTAQTPVGAHAAEAATVEFGGLTDATPATLRQRTRMRARVRYLRRLRELQLRDIGGFMLEQHRRGRLRPDLVQGKVQSAAGTDRELRVLEQALAEDVPVQELRTAGIGGACRNCGNVHGSVDRYCSWCGQRL